ncbi:MAG TPA: hypothetical protein VM940_00310 [Chthoniobacterales bacterium]|jgi:hypothetical protein|nr:hypothetical protein [Chthoniobacterales bacterium]
MRNDDEQQSEWPKDVLIRQTLDAAAADLDEDYDQESDGGDTLMNEVGESMDVQEIHSWADLDLPAGYEIIDEDQAAGYRVYLESRRRKPI